MIRPLRSLASRGATSASLEGPPPRPLETQAISASLEAPSIEPPAGPRNGGNSASLETTLGRLGRRPNHPTGRGTFTRQPLHSMGWESYGVRRRRLASASMPHSRRERRLLNLRPPLCYYSRRGVGLRRSVRTCLTPPTTVPSTLVLFSSLQDPRPAWATTLRHRTILDQGKTVDSNTLGALPHPT